LHLQLIRGKGSAGSEELVSHGVTQWAFEEDALLASLPEPVLAHLHSVVEGVELLLGPIFLFFLHLYTSLFGRWGSVRLGNGHSWL